MEQQSVTLSGFNTFLSKIFMWMFAGLFLTGLTSVVVASSPTLITLLFSNQILFFALIIGEFFMVATLSKNALKYTYQKTIGFFLAYSVLNGVTLSIIFIAYTGSTIFFAFVSASIVFGIMAIYGYLTKTDLSPFKSFLMISVIGILVLSVINIFIASGSLSYWIGIFGVVIFAGLTAYDLQKMKQIYVFSLQNNGALQGNLAVTGALTLYLDFINIFLFMLRILGRRK